MSLSSLPATTEAAAPIGARRTERRLGGSELTADFAALLAWLFPNAPALADEGPIAFHPSSGEPGEAVGGAPARGGPRGAPAPTPPDAAEQPDQLLSVSAPAQSGGSLPGEADAVPPAAPEPPLEPRSTSPLPGESGFPTEPPPAGEGTAPAPPAAEGLTRLEADARARVAAGAKDSVEPAPSAAATAGGPEASTEPHSLTADLPLIEASTPNNDPSNADLRSPGWVALEAEAPPQAPDPAEGGDAMEDLGTDASHAPPPTGPASHRPAAAEASPAPLDLGPRGSVDPSDLAQQVAERAAAELRGGRSRVEVLLDPPELGRVHVRILSDASGVTARLEATQEATRALLEAGTAQLLRSLEQAGVTVQGVSVTLHLDLGSHAGGRRTYGEGRPRRPGRGEPVDGGSEAVSPLSPASSGISYLA